MRNCDWEQRKLLDMSERICVGFVGTCEQYYTDSTGIPMYRTGNLNGLYLNKDDLKYVTQEFHNKNMKSQLKRGDILIARHGDSGKAVIYNYSDEANCLNIVIIRPNSNECDYRFLAQCINSPMPSKQIKGLSAGSTQSVINTKEIEKLVVSVPRNVEEQKVLANFLFNLDNDIALHQRKSTLLKQLKQTYLKQIFPQNKENIPALRFAGFSEPWKQHKFDEVFSHVQNNSLSRADLNYNGGYAMNIHYGDILIRFGEYLDVSKCKLPMIANKQLVEKYKASFLKDGDIVIADAAEDETVGKCSELRGIEDANILAGLHTIPSRPNWTFAPGYLGYYMNSSAFHDQLLPLIQGTKISSISKSALKKTDIKYPYGKEEQTKIGNLFKQLDDSISLHQSKLEKLTDLKQVLLAKMFV